MAATAEIPEQATFKASEVCAIARVQPYVLRSWEGEFSALGAEARGGARVYRRVDVELVLEIKRLLYEEGLTLGAARRRLEGEETVEPGAVEVPAATFLAPQARERIVEVKQGLRSILDLLAADAAAGRDGGADEAPAPAVPEDEAAPPGAGKPRAARTRGAQT